MVNVTIICVGKLKEKFYIESCQEYEKRLKGYCKLEICQINEERLKERPSQLEIDGALKKEADQIVAKIPRGSTVIPMCIEGEQMSSETLAERFARWTVSSKPRLCFIIGGSYGLHESVKTVGDERLSMSKMTFPHHLARVMLLEQIYRCFKIEEGSSYHK